MDNLFAAQLRSLEQISRGQQQQTALFGRIGLEQIEQLRSISHTMDALLSEMESIRQTQAQGLALQQAMLAREVFQDKMEEFVYQFQKMVAEFQRPQSEYPPPTQYYLLDGLFEQIDDRRAAADQAAPSTPKCSRPSRGPREKGRSGSPWSRNSPARNRSGGRMFKASVARSRSWRRRGRN